MKIIRQSYLEYLQARILFQFRVGVWLEFDAETDVTFERKRTDNAMDMVKNGDECFACMKLGRIARMKPQLIAERLYPYVIDVDGVERAECVNGYLNIYFDRAKFIRRNFTIDLIKGE